MIHWLEKQTQEALQKDPEGWISGQENSGPVASSHDLYELAAAYYIIREPIKALRLCRMSLMKDMNYIPSLYSLCLLHFEEGRHNEAQKFFQRALRIDSVPDESVLYVQKRLRSLMQLPDATRWGRWCLEELHRENKASAKTQFELGKIMFERSEFRQAVPILKSLVGDEQYCFEVSQYLSYIYERIYSGDELVERVLDLAHITKEKSDLFFNLAMVCQHDQNRLDLAIHLFYLASRSEPDDPGLKFSLEQACLEFIGKIQKPKTPEDHLNLLLAHLYHGSVAVAERYARILRKSFGWSFPESFKSLVPQVVWKDWLLKDDGVFRAALGAWFSERPLENWRHLGKKNEV